MHHLLEFSPRAALLASLLQADYGIDSARMLLEQLQTNLRYRWVMGLSPDDSTWQPKQDAAAWPAADCLTRRHHRLSQRRAGACGECRH
jgi:Transposase domain (DUF772)